MKSKKLFLRFVFIVLSITTFCLIYAYYEARNIQLKEIVFSHKDIPDQFDGKKIIFISDIHTDKYFDGERIEELVKTINDRNPDLILIGGDNVSAKAYIDTFIHTIKGLKSTYGVYTVLGNHDHWNGAERIKEGLLECGFAPCDNQSYWIRIANDSIKIGGVGDCWEDEQLIHNTISDVTDNDFCILLSHNPDYMEMLDSNKVDLMLSGHTHGGQITLFGLWAPITPSTAHPQHIQTGQKYIYGFTSKNNTQLYTTSGIGMGGLPFRFFAQPEIVEITLKKERLLQKQ